MVFEITCLTLIFYCGYVDSTCMYGLNSFIIGHCLGGPLLSFECDNVTIVTRAGWSARASKEINYMGTPVSVIFIHHTDKAECATKDTCSKEMRSIQDFAMDGKNWDDIGYNYLIGQDGWAHEGRAWDRIGAHTYGWNDVAIAFSVLGNFTDHLPNNASLSAIMNMIECGIQLGKITTDYKLFGHRDVRPTECPGNEFYDHIRTWDNFGELPPVKPTQIP